MGGQPSVDDNKGKLQLFSAVIVILVVQVCRVPHAQRYKDGDGNFAFPS